jgi:hypothetical protein
MHGPSPLPLFIELGVAVALGGSWLLRHRIAHASHELVRRLAGLRPRPQRAPAEQRARNA